jgi:hypothetical protein
MAPYQIVDSLHQCKAVNGKTLEGVMVGLARLAGTLLIARFH